MFLINGDNISLSVGDTATLVIKKTGDLVLNPAYDRVLFTIKNSSGDAVIQKILTPANDGSVTVSFDNDMTDHMSAGVYSYDVRYVVNASIVDGHIVGGDRVITPKLPQTFTLLSVVGDV